MQAQELDIIFIVAPCVIENLSITVKYREDL